MFRFARMMKIENEGRESAPFVMKGQVPRFFYWAEGQVPRFLWGRSEKCPVLMQQTAAVRAGNAARCGVFAANFGNIYQKIPIEKGNNYTIC